MRSDASAGEDGSVLWFHRPDQRIGICFLKCLADAGYCSACSDAGAETVDLTSRLREDLPCGLRILSLNIGRILELLRNKHLTVLRCQLFSLDPAVIDTFADVSVVVDEYYFRTIMLNELTPLDADRIRHDDDRAVSSDGTDEGKSYALVAAGGFHDYAVRMKPALLLCAEDHVVCRARLDGTSDIKAFVFDEDLRRVRSGHAVKSYQRGIAKCFENVIAYGVSTHLDIRVSCRYRTTLTSCGTCLR